MMEFAEAKKELSDFLQSESGESVLKALLVFLHAKRMQCENVLASRTNTDKSLFMANGQVIMLNEIVAGLVDMLREPQKIRIMPKG